MNWSKTLLIPILSALVPLAACGDETEGVGPTDRVDATTSTSDADASTTTPDATGDIATDATDDAEVIDNTPTLVEIVSPPAGTSVRDSVLVRAEAVGRDELLVDDVSIVVNGTTVRQDVKLPTEFVLDTATYGSGPLTIAATAVAGFDSGSHTVDVTMTNPPIGFGEVSPERRIVRDGQVVSVTVGMDGPPDLELAADFSAIDENFAPEMVTAYPTGAGNYNVSYILSSDTQRPDGDYIVPITATSASWTVEYRQLVITLRNRTESAAQVPEGLFVDAVLPQPTNDAVVIPRPEVSSSATSVVTGGSAPLTVDFSAHERPEEIIGVIIGLEGQAGYHQIPIADPSDLTDPAGVLDTTMFLRAYASFESPPSILPVRVAVRDSLGRVSAYGSQVFDVVAVGSGDIQVSVNWDAPTDVDLHVIDPFGEEIYYGNRESSSGGELDLDSNAACGIDGVNNENVFWPDGGAPIGDYTVRVAYWSDCGGLDTNYTVTINYCGTTEVHEGFFAGGTSTGGGAGTGVDIATVNNAICQTSVRGRVRYQDRTFDRTGFGATTWRPVRNAVVELRRLQGGEVIGTGFTDENGDYDVGFTNDGPPGVIVAVRTETDASLGLRDVIMMDHPKFEEVYEITSSPLVFEQGQEVLVRDIDITEELDAGAFNVFDQFIRGYDLVRRATGKDLGELRGFWATGADTTDTIFCSDFLYETGVCSELDSVSVQGKDADRDEYDDMVILKEFFKFALDGVSRDDHPGGSPAGIRTGPNLAWSEGVSTFFANDVVRSRYFVNSRPLGVYLVEDVEAPTTPFAFATSDETMMGDLAPELVATLLWDIADASDNEVFDNVEGGQTGIYDVLFNYLPSEDYVDRGAPGVDLVDFLDGWFCRGWGQRSAMEALLDQRAFAYDFGGPTECGAAPADPGGDDGDDD